MTHEHAGKGSGKLVDTAKVAKLLIHPGDAFLDIGCGPGDYLREASRVARTVVGIDLHASSIEAARAAGFDARLGDATKRLPFKKDSFDAILLANVLHGFVANGESDAVLAQIYRVLGAGGRLGVVEFTKASPTGPPPDVKLSSAQVTKLLALHGFSRIGKTYRVGLFHYLLLFGKGRL